MARTYNDPHDHRTSAIFELQREAGRRIQDLLATVETVTSWPQHETGQIKSDLARLEAMAKEVRVQP